MDSALSSTAAYCAHAERVAACVMTRAHRVEWTALAVLSTPILGMGMVTLEAALAVPPNGFDDDSRAAKKATASALSSTAPCAAQAGLAA